MSLPPIRTPHGGGWREIELVGWRGVPNTRRWLHAGRGVVVISALEPIENRGPTWHVSISRFVAVGALGISAQVGRARDVDVAFVREAFRLRDAEEDNHARIDGRGGLTRNLWLEVDPAMRTPCDCKELEEAVVEPDGFTFTRPRREHV